MLATNAMATSTGTMVGKSGNPAQMTAYGNNCFGCHKADGEEGNPNAPFSALVNISGPQTLMVRPGAMTDILLTIESDAPAAGFNLSKTDGELIDLTESGAQDNYVAIDNDVNEATHNSPTALIDGTQTWMMRWQAPMTEGDVTFYACTNPVNRGNDGPSGDGAPVAQACVSQVISVAIGENTAPVSLADDTQTDQNTPVVIDVLANDSDDIQLLGSSLLIETDPINGSATVNKVSGTLSYTPKVGYSGIDSFTYSVEDGEGLRSEPVAVNLTVILTSGAPIITGGDYSTFETTPLSIDVLSAINATSSIDFTDDDIEITRINNGSVTIETNGSLTYVADVGYSGVDSFNYVINAADGAVSNEATSYVTVTEKRSSDGGSVNGLFMTLIALFGFYRRIKK
jgi:hypothetical protein